MRYTVDIEYLEYYLFKDSILIDHIFIDVSLPDRFKSHCINDALLAIL